MHYFEVTLKLQCNDIQYCTQMVGDCHKYFVVLFMPFSKYDFVY